MARKQIRSIIEEMIPYYIQYNRSIMDIAAYFNKNSVAPKQLVEDNYKWDIQKKDEDI